MARLPDKALHAILCHEGAEEVQLDATQLAMILDGIDVRRVKPPARWEPSAKK